MSHLANSEFDPTKPDAVFDLDGTVFKFTVLEQYVTWLCDQQVFEPLSKDIEQSRLVWKSSENNEANYKEHTSKLVRFFIGQVAGKNTTTLQQAAEIVAGQTAYRQWDITRNLVSELRDTHNVMAISLMPDWLMPPFTRDLGFVARIGCTYVTQDNNFTGEAYTIDKATAYRELRQDDTTNLDIAMGDTMGDLSIFNIARRPIAFNPSFTLASEVASRATMVSAGKDLVTVSNTRSDGKLYSKQFHCGAAAEVLKLVKIQPELP